MVGVMKFQNDKISSKSYTENNKTVDIAQVLILNFNFRINLYFKKISIEPLFYHN